MHTVNLLCAPHNYASVCALRAQIPPLRPRRATGAEEVEEIAREGGASRVNSGWGFRDVVLCDVCVVFVM